MTEEFVLRAPVSNLPRATVSVEARPEPRATWPDHCPCREKIRADPTRAPTQGLAGSGPKDRNFGR